MSDDRHSPDAATTHVETLLNLTGLNPTEAEAVESLLAERQRYREALHELRRPKYGVATMTVAERAMDDA